MAPLSHLKSSKFLKWHSTQLYKAKTVLQLLVTWPGHSHIVNSMSFFFSFWSCFPATLQLIHCWFTPWERLVCPGQSGGCINRWLRSVCPPNRPYSFWAPETTSAKGAGRGFPRKRINHRCKKIIRKMAPLPKRLFASFQIYRSYVKVLWFFKVYFLLLIMTLQQGKV